MRVGVRMCVQMLFMLVCTRVGWELQRRPVEQVRADDAVRALAVWRVGLRCARIGAEVRRLGGGKGVVGGSESSPQ